MYKNNSHVKDFFFSGVKKSRCGIAPFLSLTSYQESVEWIKLHVCLYYRAVIGEIDEETDSALDLGNIRAEPLNSVVH